MRYYSLVLFTITAFAQQSTTYTYDSNGRTVASGVTFEQRTAGEVAKIQTTRDVNGRRVPVIESEERVISDDSRIRIVERTLRSFGPDGQPLPPERVRLETERRGDGSEVTTTQTWRADLNRNYQLAERSVTETRKTGDATTSSTLVERPSVNGAMEMWEKREQLIRTPSPQAQAETTTVYHKDPNGRLGESVRISVDRSTQNGSTVENAATYQNGQLTGQTVTRSSNTPSGQDVEMDIFVTQGAGRADSGSDRRLSLRERRLIERKYSADGSVESVSVQMPDVNSSRLGAPKKIEETVCTGACKPPAPAETPAPARQP